VAAAGTLPHHDRVHQPQTLKGIPGVTDLPGIQLGEVVFHVGAGQRRSPKQHRRVGQATGVHLLQVLLHDHRGLDEQSRHPDGICMVLHGRLQDRADGLLDAEVDHLVAVVGQDDVYQVLADVMDVTFHGGQHQPAFACIVLGSLHVRLEMRDRCLHHLGRLQYERQLHLP
jgi:hypothetical protein